MSTKRWQPQIFKRVRIKQTFAVQFESIAGFSAIIDRLGEFAEVLQPYSGSHSQPEQSSAAESSTAPATNTTIQVEDVVPSAASPLLTIDSLSLRSPDGGLTLVQDLSIEVMSHSVSCCLLSYAKFDDLRPVRACNWGVWQTSVGFRK